MKRVIVFGATGKGILNVFRAVILNRCLIRQYIIE